MVSPAVLKSHGCPVYRVLQEPGQFVVTWPAAYHAGFSHGFNICEAVNFAVPQWISFGDQCSTAYAHCRRPSPVKFKKMIFNIAQHIDKYPNLSHSDLRKLVRILKKEADCLQR